MSEVCNLTLQKRNREKLKEEILLLSGNEWLRVSCLFSKNLYKYLYSNLLFFIFNAKLIPKNLSSPWQQTRNDVF